MNLTLTCPAIRIGVKGINSSKAPRNSDGTTKRGHTGPPVGNVCAARPAHAAHAFLEAALMLRAELRQQGGAWAQPNPGACGWTWELQEMGGSPAARQGPAEVSM